jgi:hypothetical protein
MAAAKTGYTCISASIQDSKEIPTAICMFWGQKTQWRYREGSLLKPEVRNSRWRLSNWKYLISASIQDSKEISKANPMFSGSENSMVLLVMLYLETGSEKFKMATAKPELHVSQLRYKIAKKFVVFSGSGNSMTP